MSKYKAYPAYKDSGVEWLGEIPEGWDFTNIGFLTQKIGSGKTPRGGSETYVDAGVLFLRSQNVYDDGLKLDSNNTVYISNQTDEEMSNSRVKSGDILLNITGASIGRTCLVPENIPKSNVNQHVCIIRTHEKLNNFLSWYLKSNNVKAQIDISQNGAAREGLNFEQLSKIIVSIPQNRDEQTQIASFLDHETARIDTLIAKQETLIALLKEKRQAVISHAVTKGLNPNVEMKDSGVEWLGEVPAHWEICRIKNIVSTPVTDGPHETPEFLDEGVPFVSAEAVSTGEINFNKIRGFISLEDHKKYSKKYRPQKYDVYMVKSGATTGITAIVETDKQFNIWSPLAVIRCKNDSNPYFVLSFLRSYQFQEAVELNWSFGTQQNIGMGVIENIHITRPPVEEAKNIALQLNRDKKLFDVLLKKAEESISLIKERRTALISAAVTGKIDLRDWQAPDNES